MSQEVSSEIIIDIPRAAAWGKLQDISLAHHYVPGIVKTKIVSVQRSGVGASRYVYRNEKSYIQETVQEWNVGSGFLIKLHRGEKSAPPFKNASFRYQLDEAGPNGTRFTASLCYQMPWGGFGQWLGKRMQPIVQKVLDDVTAAMKLYYETGEPTTPAALKAFKKSRP